MYISTRERDRLNKLKKQQQKAEQEAAFKKFEQNCAEQKRIEELPEINIYCPHCNTLLFLIGKPKDLIGREFRCLECLGSFVVCKQPGIVSRTVNAIMKPFVEIYEEDKRQKEAGKLTFGEKVLGFAIGAYIGLNLHKKKDENR